ncbi:MAG: hypothetical protein WKG00_40545, partial [Polyangiaceae bacterium]
MKKSSFVTVAVLAGFASSAYGQDPSPAPAPAPGGDEGGTAPNVTVLQVPGAQSTQTTVVSPGYPTPGTNLEGHLPSSSHASSDTSRSSDGFDLLPDRGAGGSGRGAAGGSYVVEGQ